jgi:hypothetical protein
MQRQVQNTGILRLRAHDGTVSPSLRMTFVVGCRRTSNGKGNGKSNGEGNGKNWRGKGYGLTSGPTARGAVTS